MEDGRICGFGSHEELMAACEPYKAIYRSQIGDEGVPGTGTGEGREGIAAGEDLAAEKKPGTKGGSIHG